MDKTAGIDLYKLGLLRLVAEQRSFTAAAGQAGISQSALSRQIQAMETQLGVTLFDRTTRSVRITEAGAILLRETEAIPNLLSGAVRRVREECGDARKRISVGVSNELALSHMPGFFHSGQQAKPEVRIEISLDADATLFERVKTNHLDLGIVCEDGKKLDQVRLMHRMEDRFVIIAPHACAVPPGNPSRAAMQKWADRQDWILPSATTTTGNLVNGWIRKAGWQPSPVMEIGNFDLMVQFVALGMGVAFVPSRALSGFPRTHLIRKLEVPLRFSRTLVAITPPFSRTPDHVKGFLEGILFS
jgi:DNA-binding transcriptional LysR family regulator